MFLLNKALNKVIIRTISMGKFLTICALSFFLMLTLYNSSAECMTPENIDIRYEVLVESRQLRTVLIDGENITVEDLIQSRTVDKRL